MKFKQIRTGCEPDDNLGKKPAAPGVPQTNTNVDSTGADNNFSILL